MAALGSAAYLGWHGRSEADRLSHTCAPSCDPSLVSPIRRELLIADLSLMAGLGLGTLTAWIIWNGRADETVAAPMASNTQPARGGAGWSLVARPSYLHVEYGGRF